MVHNRYQIAGGEDSVVAAGGCCERTGIRWLYRRIPRDPRGSLQGAGGALSDLLSSRSAGARSSDRLRWPDVVHVHNFFPSLSPSIYDACATRGPGRSDYTTTERSALARC